jgi:hypothetical protein
VRSTGPDTLFTVVVPGFRWALLVVTLGSLLTFVSSLVTFVSSLVLARLPDRPGKRASDVTNA